MKFFLDHDVPGNIALLLRYWGHEATVLRDALPVTATDDEAFAHARANAMIPATADVRANGP